MNYSKIVGGLVVFAILATSIVLAGPNSKNWDKAGPWTIDTYLSGATTTGAASAVVVTHDSPVSNYSCVITLATNTAYYVNVDFQGSLDNTTYFHLPVSGATISLAANTALLLSTATWTVQTAKPMLYTRMVYSQNSYSTLVGQGATAVTGKCVAY